MATATKAKASTTAETKPGTIAGHRRREATSVADLAAARANLVAAVERKAEYREEWDDARARVEAIRRAWQNGDDSIPAAALRDAEAEVERASSP